MTSSYTHTLETEAKGREKYARGYIVTVWGVVGVYWQEDGPYTDLKLVREHHLYTRTFERLFTDRSLAVMAGRFAREIVEGW